jgi:ABC-type antimicrobial peptide transport system permease subunit
LGIGIGMATILFLISIGFGVQKIVLEKITTPESLLSIDIKGKIDSKEDLNWNDINKINQIREIEEVVSLNKQKGQIKVGDYFSSSDVLLTEPGYVGMDGKRILFGEDISDENISGVLVSSTFLTVLEKNPQDLLGKNIEVILSEDSEKKLVNIDEEQLKTGLKIVGVVEDDKSNIYIHLNNFNSTQIKKISLIKVKTFSQEQVEKVKETLVGSGYEVASVSEVVDQTKKFFTVLSFALTVLGIVALFVSSIGMFNTMIIALLERTEEIGVMKAIGAKDRDILSIFVVESGLIGFLGGITGVLIGFLVQGGVNFVFNFVAIQMGGQKLDLFYSPVWFVVSLVIISFVIGIITGWIPAKRASRVDPLEALKD